MGLASPAISLACLGSRLFAFDVGTLGPPLSLHAAAWPGSSFSVFQCARLDLLSPVLDNAETGSISSIQQLT